MATKRARLAKLAAPRLHQAVARERLFRLLDEKRPHAVIWVSGPPGAGKTTLVASYLQAIGAPAVWYHLDQSDSDPATLFYYLAEAVSYWSTRRARALPLLSPEYLPDLEGFARRFFRSAFMRLPAGAPMVFDNYHEIAEDSGVHRVLNAAFQEVPRTANVIVMSRIPPPASFARMQLTDALVTLGWDDLRLTADETAAIAATRVRGISGELVDAIHAESGGWAAGVRLLLDRVQVTGVPARPGRTGSLEGVFEYFAAEIFDAAPADVQQLLLRTAFLPRFTAEMAVAASGSIRAGRVLDDLYRRRLFVERRDGRESTYQYHDLFRAFLRTRAERVFPREEIASIARESAIQLLARERADEAFGLFVYAADWERAEQLLIDRANVLIAHGRWQTLEDWGGSLPAERRRRNPWLGYWLGRSKTLVDPAAARVMLEDAHSAFAARNDRVGELLSATAVLDALHFEVKAFDLLGIWLERLAHLVGTCPLELPVEDELRIHAALLMASHLAVPRPMLARAVERVKQLLPRCTDANLTLSVANMVHYYSGHTLDFDAHRVAAHAARPLLDRAEISSDRLALYWLAEGHAHYMFARYRQALECIERADRIIDEHGLAQRAAVAGAWRCQCEAANGDVRAAQATIAALDKGMVSGHGYTSALLEWAKGCVAFAAGETARSIELAMAAIECNRASGAPISHALWLPRVAYRLIVAGRIEQGAAVVVEQQAWADAVAHCRLGAALATLEAWVAYLKHDAAGCECALRRAVTLARDERESLRLHWLPRALADLLPFALERGIEPDVVRQLIANTDLRPSDPGLEAWPWPVRVYTLGRFELLVDDKPVPFGRKVPKRTLALLKAIIAYGGTEVAEQRLADALWPDQDGDLAHESLAAALHRLRRLLGGNQAILQSSGTLSLNPERCFVDVWAFESGLRRAGREQAALHLYRGAFLQGDADAQWSVSLRERLRTRFVGAVQAAAQRSEAEGRHAEAVALYTRGLEVDDLVEPFYQGLMRSYRSLDRIPEATATFHRLSRTLGATLGLQPSLESQRLLDPVTRVKTGA